jgi:CRP-like cAMP-binding protein
MTPPTTDPSVESTLARCGLLEPLSDDAITVLAGKARMVTLREGEALFDQDSVAHSLFVVAGGRLAIRLSTPAGVTIEVVEVGQYGVSGWSSVVAPDAYVAEAKALEDTSVVAVSAADVETVLLSEPEAGYEVMKKLAGLIARRLREMKEELIEVLER